MRSENDPRKRDDAGAEAPQPGEAPHSMINVFPTATPSDGGPRWE